MSFCIFNMTVIPNIMPKRSAVCSIPGTADELIFGMCRMIKNNSVNMLHIIAIFSTVAPIPTA